MRQTYHNGVHNGKFSDDEEGVYLANHPEDGNLAYYLVNTKGYTPNVDLFVFNYPNEDAVVHSANKFDVYLQNLATRIRNSGDSQDKLSFYGKTNNLTETTPYKINIVGHSMGGLVARYYIENIGKDENVDKLITIGTPHWGSELADSPDILATVFGEHKLCDHDLKTNSKIFGGSNSESISCSYGCPSGYTLTDELNWYAPRNTKYYAIAGIDYDSDGLDSNDCPIEISTSFSTFNDIYDELQEATNYRLCIVGKEDVKYIDIKLVGDNVVGFLSQIGCTESGDTSPDKKINFERIFVNIDSNDGNSLLNHFHGKMVHREVVMEKVGDFLND